MIGQYIHGNRPSHHLPYLYSYAGAPLKTQARLKQIVDSQYKPTPMTGCSQRPRSDVCLGSFSLHLVSTRLPRLDNTFWAGLS